MPEPATPRRRHAWVLAWLLLTSLAFAVHTLAWVPPDRLDAGLSGMAEFPGTKTASNALDVYIGGFWVAMEVLTRDWGVYDTVRTLFVCGAGAALVLAIGRLVKRMRAWLASRPAPPGSTGVDLVRRRLVIESPLVAVSLIAGGVPALGAGIDPYRLKVRRYRLPIADLPATLDGLRAVFIADTHLGPRVPAAFIKKAIAESISLRPDLVLLGGDYVHAGSRYIQPAVDLLRPFTEASIPMVGVLGNHDWYNSQGLISKRLRDCGVHMVDNGHVMLDAQTRRLVGHTPGEALCIAGVGDLLCDRVDLDAALQGVPDSMPRLVLSHNPDAAELPALHGGSARGRRVDLMLCGHTHGGQVRLPLCGPLYVPGGYGSKYEGGLVQGPAFPVLVSRGVGMSICPVRIGVPPELVELTLTRV